MLVSFALVPPPELSQRLAALRARLDPQHAPKTIPHLTVKQPFHCQPSDFERVVTRVGAFGQVHAAVAVSMRESGVFDTIQYGSVLHLHAPRTRELDALHTWLLNALADLSTAGPARDVEQRTFYPHLTLAQGLESGPARALLASLEVELPLDFLARELVMGVRDDHGMWHRPHIWSLLSASLRATSSA
jgi:2'-5' RNA ligase